MNTDEIIQTLRLDLSPVLPGAAARRIGRALIVGGLCGLLVMILLYGAPLGAVSKTGVMVFMMKLAFAAAITGLAARLLLAAGRPGEKLAPRSLWLALPLLIVAMAAMMELAGSSGVSATELLFGSTWKRCLVDVAGVSLFVFGALLSVFSRLAPVRLRLTGFIAGLCSGAMGTVVYALYCPEASATFMLVWYTLAMMLPALVGALVGPRLLRW